MGNIEDDQALCLRRKVHSELPGDGPTPVVTDNDSFVSSKMANESLNVSYQVAHRVVLTSLRFIAQIVATQIERNDLETGSKRDHLVAPGIPKVGEAMDQDDQRSLAYTGVVDGYSVIVCIPMGHVFVDLNGDDGRCSVLHLCLLSHLSLCGCHCSLLLPGQTPPQAGFVSVDNDTLA